MFGGKEEEKDPNKPERIFEIPAKTVKTGALKFFLQVALVQIANVPEKGTWYLKEGEQEDDIDSVDVYFKDGSGMVSLGFAKTVITADRYGSRPSLVYQLQESILLHQVLDEFQKVAFEMDDIELDKRLLQVEDETIIDKVRATLPGRADSPESSTES